jgi:hypothetical protein
MFPERHLLAFCFSAIILIGMFGGEARAGVITTGALQQQLEDGQLHAEVLAIRCLESESSQHDLLRVFIRDLREMVVAILGCQRATEIELGLVTRDTKPSFPSVITIDAFDCLDIRRVSERSAADNSAAPSQGVRADLMRPPET